MRGTNAQMGGAGEPLNAVGPQCDVLNTDHGSPIFYALYFGASVGPLYANPSKGLRIAVRDF